MEAEEIELLREANGTAAVLTVDVHGCAYSCCGKGWHRRDGYWQQYRGRIDNLQLPTDEELAQGMVGTFMLYSMGVGTVSYVCAVRFSEVEAIESQGARI